MYTYYKDKNKLSYTDFTKEQHVKEHSWQSLCWEAKVRKRQSGSFGGGAEPKYGAVFFNEQGLLFVHRTASLYIWYYFQQTFCLEMAECVKRKIHSPIMNVNNVFCNYSAIFYDIIQHIQTKKI